MFASPLVIDLGVHFRKSSGFFAAQSFFSAAGNFSHLAPCTFLATVGFFADVSFVAGSDGNFLLGVTNVGEAAKFSAANFSACCSAFFAARFSAAAALLLCRFPVRAALLHPSA